METVSFDDSGGDDSGGHKSGGHESDDRLELYALNRLADSEIGPIEEHLLVCDSCRDRLDDIGAFALTMREGLKNQPVSERKPAGSVG